MTTVKKVFADTKQLLETAGLANAESEARLILQHVLSKTGAQLFAEPNESVSPPLFQEIDRLVKRRLNHEPLQYILNSVNFLGEDFFCDQRALIPRPETELLVEKVSGYVKKLQIEKGRFLDLGTGSGVIAITLKRRFPSAQIFASDCSYGTLALARENAARHRCLIHLSQSDLLEDIKGKFAAIIANLPYVPTRVWLSTEPEVRHFEPKQAIWAGRGGLRYIRPLIRQVADYLEEKSLLALEIWPSQTRAIWQLAGCLPRHNLEFAEDLSGQTRFAFFLPSRQSCPKQGQ